MSILIFDPADVRRVVEHSLAAPEQRKQVTGYDEAKGELTYGAPHAPAVMLVHDDGVYLMSNGTPSDRLDANSTEKFGRCFVAYADGCNPRKDTDWYDRARDLVGGDDFAETLPWAKEMLAMVNDRATAIVINFGGRNMSLSYRITGRRKRNGSK